MQHPDKPEGQALLPGDTNGVAHASHSTHAAHATSSGELRERAEQAVRQKPPLSAMDFNSLSPELMRQTLHELQVHQIELQMQNEELQTTQIRLDKSRARYFDLYDLAPVGYCTVSEQGLITETNLAVASLLGLSRIHVINQPISRFVHRAHQNRYYAYRNQVTSTGTARTCELQLVKSDGSNVWVTMTTTTVIEDDGALVLRMVLGDTTARKQMDQLLQDQNTALDEARHVADKANHAKSEFLSSMSHELRTPLNAILGFAQLINADSPTPTQKKSLDQILLAGWYLLDLINEILDLALVESGKLSLELAPVALAGVLHDCRTMIEPQAEQRGISLRYEPLDVNFLVLADGMRLKQVLINLLSNAIKYNRPGGAVVVTCTEVADTHVRIGVKDTGEGLSPEQIGQLFQPFNRLGQESRPEQGTGIGLVMTKRLVGLMGGTIYVESAVGSGSTFWIEMKLTQAQTPSPVVASAPDRAAASGSAPVKPAAGLKNDMPLRTLLYIEDDPANLLLIESLMGHRPDIHLLSAQDGAQGLALAKMHLPDVILTDIHLPGISGIELLKILQDNPATKHIPVVALSANAIPSDIDKGLATGFYRYLTKPIKIDVFMTTLDAALLLATARHADKTSTASSLDDAP